MFVHSTLVVVMVTTVVNIGCSLGQEGINNNRVRAEAGITSQLGTIGFPYFWVYVPQ